MKKLLFILLTMISLGASAQSVFKIVEFRRSVYDTYSGKWNYGIPKETDMALVVYGNVFQITDQARSNYRTGAIYSNKETATLKEITWEATDENNISCYFSIQRDEVLQESHVLIMYPRTSGSVMYSYKYVKQ